MQKTPSPIEVYEIGKNLYDWDDIK